MSPNQVSIARADELQAKTTEYLSYKSKIQQMEKENHSHYLQQKKKLLKYFDGSSEDWQDWHWQMSHRITEVDLLSEFVFLSENEIVEIKQVAKRYRFAIVPYYLALISSSDSPIKKMSIPAVQEILDNRGLIDPMSEEFTNPAGSITRRYPDRLIINVTNMCAMYCRHCQRRRLIGIGDHHTQPTDINDSIVYIRNHPEIRDVLLTGGDALLLSDDELENILIKLRAINHIEIIRIGSRVPVTMPMRITTSLARMIQKYHPVYLNTQFNHPFEITDESTRACSILSNHGIQIGNQSVLLKGINDTPFLMTCLCQKLLEIRVRPYYLFHAKSVLGTTHFIPKLKTGLSIMEFMRGFTSGLAIPTYIMNAPGGLGKVPILPNYVTLLSEGHYSIRTWENKHFQYDDFE